MEHEIEFFAPFFSFSRDLYFFSLFAIYFMHGKCKDRRKCVEQLRINMFQGYIFMLDGGWIYIYGFRYNRKFFMQNERKIQFYLFVCCDWQNAKTIFLFKLISTDTCQHWENLVNWDFFQQTKKCICLMEKNGKRFMKLRVQCHTIERGDPVNAKWQRFNSDNTTLCPFQILCEMNLECIASLGWKDSLDLLHSLHYSLWIRLTLRHWIIRTHTPNRCIWLWSSKLHLPKMKTKTEKNVCCVIQH